MDRTKEVAVIIPFYKNGLSDYEKVALQQCQKVLSAHPVIAVKPHSLVLPNEATNFPIFETESFDDEYFKNIQGYNRLMTDAVFYKRFLDYKYILIYQLDAFVFSDELHYWCNQNIDYVGAPWIGPNHTRFFEFLKNRVKSYIHTRYNFQRGGLPSAKQFEYKVGNGGFSLRKTKKFYDICLSHQKQITYYNNLDNHLFNEDIFWSIEVNRKRRVLNIPSYKTGLKFSFEFNPERALITNHNILPFGCHAWDLNIDFWRPVFMEHGYIV